MRQQQQVLGLVQQQAARHHEAAHIVPAAQAPAPPGQRHALVALRQRALALQPLALAPAPPRAPLPPLLRRCCRRLHRLRASAPP
jgi:hypothetical protein